MSQVRDDTNGFGGMCPHIELKLSVSDLLTSDSERGKVGKGCQGETV